jgi:hypothetical protein
VTVAASLHIQPRRRYMAMPSHSCNANSEFPKLSALGSHGTNLTKAFGSSQPEWKSAARLLPLPSLR